MATLVSVQDEEQRAQARELIREYLQWINAGVQHNYGICFDIEAMITSDLTDSEKFSPPWGRFYLVNVNEQVAGIGALKRIADQVGEVQRMYVRPSFRGQGIGRQIGERLVADARIIGYQTLRLESLKFLTSAHALYRSLGFQEIDPYSGNSMRAYQSDAIQDTYRANAVFMEMQLS